MTAARPLIWFNLLPIWKRRLSVWGNSLRGITLDRLVYLHLHRLGLMGREERRFLERKIRPGMFVVDVGANLGLYTLLLSRLVGESGKVVAFEPDPELFQGLESNCRANSATNVELYNLAVGSRAGSLVLARSLVNAGDNRVSPRDGASVRRVNVQVTTVDEIVAERKVDFVKIDVQGWENEVFQGMSQVLTRNPAIQMCFEYWPYGLEKAGCDPLSLLARLEQLGFSIYQTSGREDTLVTGLAAVRPAGKGYINLLAVRDHPPHPAPNHAPAPPAQE